MLYECKKAQTKNGGSIDRCDVSDKRAASIGGVGSRQAILSQLISKDSKVTVTFLGGGVNGIGR